MNRFLLLILGEISQNPSYTAQEHAAALSIPVKIVEESIQQLYEESILIHRKNSIYITFLGHIALMKHDAEKAKTSLNERNGAMRIICNALQISPVDIEHFSLIEQGMTNRSFLFTAKGNEYIFRTPGEGTDQLVDRHREYSNYLALAGKGISDVVVYHDPLSGIKITEFIPGCRMPDKTNIQDLQLCMETLKAFHKSGISVDYTFDFAQHIAYYEQLNKQAQIDFLPGYEKGKAFVQNILTLLENTEKERCFCHIDSVPGNFLISEENDVTMIDWEYAGMCDPIADVAMWCLSARYNKPACDRLIVIYLQRAPVKNEKIRFYSYLSLGGFMWSLWASYKIVLGEIYGNYVNQMFAYCLKYAQLVFDLCKEN